MKTLHFAPARRALCLLCCCPVSWAAPASNEHSEFDATLSAPFHAVAGAGAARTFTLHFSYPQAARSQLVDWELAVLSPAGRSLRRWQGRTPLAPQGGNMDSVAVSVRWSGRAALPLAHGVYSVRLRARSRAAGAPAATSEMHEQTWPIAVGKPPAPRLPPFAPLPSSSTRMPDLAPAPGALPYTVYLGNLHSQTNHSDGGAPLAACKGAQAPQTGRYGPADAFDYARTHGLDILVASEHNHMYDGSDHTRPEADPARALALYRQGLDAAAASNAAHPGFLAVYGSEWGVINGGGHVNILNGDQLPGWEKNAQGALLADVYTPRSDYGALYALMHARGWVGQFNHPATSGQFAVDGVALGYTAAGDAAMALCEVVNSTAFSSNDTETETRRSSFETACNKLLEAGFHVAFSSNQDNHCANWGTAYTNRTGVLIENGQPLTRDSFLQALRARRVFATMDKGSQLVFTANGQMMGARLTNRGPLSLATHFASTAGKQVAAVAIMEGVPGRRGTVTQLSATASTQFTPAVGPHFYYAKLTQLDGNILWSAPIWVMQEAPVEEGSGPR